MDQFDVYFDIPIFKKFPAAIYIDSIKDKNYKNLNDIYTKKLYQLEPMENKNNNSYLIFIFLLIILIFFYFFQK